MTLSTTEVGSFPGHIMVIASMNIGREAISRGFMPLDKTARLHAEAGGDVATPISTDEPMILIKAGAKPR
ncbi:MAG: hypothetical protein QXI87_08060 [Thermoproteota archaeon]